jgi:hypothetical protein
MYIPEFFRPQELVPNSVWSERGMNSLELLDDRLLITLDDLRKAYGSITINDWLWGGKNHWRGLRTSDSPVGTQYSQHRFGRAADCTFRHVSAEDVRADILNHPDRFPLINSVELDTSWLHFDVRNCERIKTYRP